MAVPFFYVSPDVGNTFVITAFVVVVLGGLGSFAGALLGGLAWRSELLRSRDDHVDSTETFVRVASGS